MRVLVACEYSAVVRDAFRSRGHDAWSCDLLPTEGDSFCHIEGDVVGALLHRRRWDLIIAHVPCTAMAVCGNRTYGKNGSKPEERQEALAWTTALWDTALDSADRVAFENGASVLFPALRAKGADVQYLHPWQHGHPEQKKTGLALHNLPRITPTNDVYEHMMTLPRKERERIHFMSPSPDRGKERARFFQGIADAMAEQWGSI